MSDDDDLERRYGGMKGKKMDSIHPDEKIHFHQGGKKKTKYVSLYSQETKDAILPGRHKCECQATKHKLVANCMSCGRIVCQQEGRGPCFFCNETVPFDPNARVVHSLKSIGESLSGPDRFKEDLAKAELHKEKLLEYDRTCEQRTRVIDDQMDYFSAESNVWLSPEQKKELMEKEKLLFAQKHAPRSQKSVRVTIDFAGRKVVQEEEEKPIMGDEEPISGALIASGEGRHNREDIASGRFVCPTMTNHDPQYEEGETADEQGRKGGHRKGWLLEHYVSRLQDKEIMEMADDGWCLSLHQPWASLLVAGVKRHEGRTWYTNFRGRLWIASTAKPVSPKDVAEMEKFYRTRYGGDIWESRIGSHELYVSGCLLGCIDLTDVLSQEEYRDKFPYGESESPYVFICASPMKLRVQFPVRGKHKLWQLEKDVHEAAKRSLIRR